MAGQIVNVAGAADAAPDYFTGDYTGWKKIGLRLDLNGL